MDNQEPEQYSTPQQGEHNSHGTTITLISLGGRDVVTFGKLKQLILEKKVGRGQKCQIGDRVGTVGDIKGLDLYFQRAGALSVMPKDAKDPAQKTKKRAKPKPEREPRGVSNLFVALVVVFIVFATVFGSKAISAHKAAKAKEVQTNFRLQIVQSVMDVYDAEEQDGKSFPQRVNELIGGYRTTSKTPKAVRKEYETRRAHLRSAYATAVRYDEAVQKDKPLFVASNGLQYETSRDGLELALGDVIVDK